MNTTPKSVTTSSSNKGILSLNPASSSSSTSNERINEILEKENSENKLDSWSKIDKMTKITKLLKYAERKGSECNYSKTEIQNLKNFFINSLDNQKLQKSKEVIYDKDTQEIKDIPALHINPITRNFTMKIIDNKRISTLKSLAPKKREKPAETVASPEPQNPPDNK